MRPNGGHLLIRKEGILHLRGHSHRRWKVTVLQISIQPKLSIFGIIAAKKMVIVKIMVIFTQSYIYMV